MLNFLRSRRAFYVILVLFAIESLWIALTARYPMAFDEYMHYGVTQLHTTTLSPFLANVPDSASLYGAITRDPSFLYHYLLSFPLRIIDLITSNQVWQILSLRVLNIGIALATVVVYRRLLLKIGVSQLTANIILFFLVLIPVMPLIAGQISYDNLFFLCVAAVLLLMVEFTQTLMRKRTIDVSRLNWMLLLGLFTCFIKYAFLPALAAMVICLAVLLIPKRKLLVRSYAKWWQTQQAWHRWLTVAVLAIGVWLFAGSYGLNMVRYHTPIPDCDHVLSIEACKDYGPWRRDYYSVLGGGEGSITQLPWFTQRWVRNMMRETFFMVGAKFNEAGVVVYFASQPIAGIFIAAWALFIAGIAAFIWYFRKIWRRLDLRLLVITIGIYTLAVFGRNLQFYLETGSPVAIHGRYVLPFIPPLIAVIAVAAAPALRRLRHRVKLGAVAIVLLMFLQGGGLITYIVSTNDDWMWPQSQLARDVTQQAREVISPVIYRR